jgi:hypothetical protein
MSFVVHAQSAVQQGAAQGVPLVDINGLDPELRRHLTTPARYPCITQDYQGARGMARYVNRCAEPLHLTIVFGNVDDVRQIDVPVKDSRTIGFDITEMKDRGGSSWYVCPQGCTAVDPAGKAFRRAVAVYLCRDGKP